MSNRFNEDDEAEGRAHLLHCCCAMLKARFSGLNIKRMTEL